MKIQIFFLALVGLAASNPGPKHFADPKVEFEDFKFKFGKVYRSIAEEEERFAVFKANLDRIVEHNNAGRSWWMGVTKFADLTKEEFVTLYLNGRKPLGGNTPTVESKTIDRSSLPDEVDWRDQGVITSVKDQGMCGSCWAFSAAAQMESYAKINDMSHDLWELSPQHLVSCAPNPLKCGGTGGCMGSVEPLAYVYANLIGVVTEEDYPYTSGDPWGSGDDEICKFNGNTQDVSVTVLGYETLPHNEMDPVLDHLANKGPLSASVAASDWGLYFGGVFDGCDYQDNIAVNHAVQLIGYGTDPSYGDYWLIKNSWGNMWGEGWEDGNGGFIKLKRESEVFCGTNETPLDGNACQDQGVTEQHVCGMCAVLFDNSYPLGTTFMK